MQTFGGQQIIFACIALSLHVRSTLRYVAVLLIQWIGEVLLLSEITRPFINAFGLGLLVKPDGVRNSHTGTQCDQKRTLTTNFVRHLFRYPAATAVRN